MLLVVVVFVLFLVVLIGSIYYSKELSKRRPNNFFGRYPRVVTLLPILPLLLILTGVFAQVGPNEVGIIYDELGGGVLQETYDQGLHLKSPFRHVTTISTTNRTAFIDVYSQTEDSIYAQFDITVIYSIHKEDAGLFFRTTGNTDISADQLNAIVKKNLQSVTTQYNVFDIMGQSLEQVRLQFQTVLAQDLYDLYHVTLVSVSINDVDAGSEIEKIIQDKAKAIQQIEIALQEKARQDVINETNRIKAETEAEIALIKANSDLAVAEKQAEAQAVLNAVAVTAINTMYSAQFESDVERSEFEINGTGGFLTIQEIAEIVVAQLYYDVWDGKLPQVITDGSSIIINPQL